MMFIDIQWSLNVKGSLTLCAWVCQIGSANLCKSAQSWPRFESDTTHRAMDKLSVWAADIWQVEDGQLGRRALMHRAATKLAIPSSEEV